MDNQYREQINYHSKKLQEVTAKSNRLGNSKLACVVLFIACLSFFFINGKPIAFLYPAAGLLILFVFLLIRHHRVHGQIHYHKGLLQINTDYLHRISGEWSQFADIGEEFISVGDHHDYGQDLDIIGKKSLFQLLNATHTFHGRNRFAADLLNQNPDIPKIQQRQKAIQELAGDYIFCNDFQYHTGRIGIHKEMPSLIATITDTKTFTRFALLRQLLHYAPVATSLFIACSFLFSAQALKPAAVVVFFVQLAIWGLGIKNIQEQISGIGKIAYHLDAYSTVFALLQKKSFHSEKLIAIQAMLLTDQFSAAKALTELNRIIQRINMRYNSVLYFLLNGLLLWDYECVYQLEEWKKKYAAHANNWFEALGEFESLLSLSNLANINRATTLPTLTEKAHTFDAVSLGHPLIPEKSRISNDFYAKNSIFIISGSNMSGKTTFMRTVGVNMVLAGAGAPVCASVLCCSVFSPVTSMRIADDLNEGISTFYAELTKIKNILDKARTDPHTFFFIDEIFRGTNSNDRLLGAKQVIHSLHSLGVMGLTTTHDLALCEAAKDKRIVNISFSETYKNGEISFDYKLKKGVSTVTNAKYLMEMLGIIPQ